MNSKKDFIILFFDIETTNLSADYGRILCCGFKYLNKKPFIVSQDQFSDYRRKLWDDRKVVEKIKTVLESADILVSYNGRRFDIPFINSRLLYHGFSALKKQRHIDLYWIIKYKYKLHRDSLKAVEDFFFETKQPLKTPVTPVHWNKAAAGVKTSLEYVKRHCLNDVLLLERLFFSVKNSIESIYL
ncbi:MAG: ribonuclease H-like domain-containing protein [Candidatus Nitrosotenuis sp.]